MFGGAEVGVLGVVHRKVASRMVKTPQLPPSSACGARLDRNFERRGLGAGWRTAGFLHWEKNPEVSVLFFVPVFWDKRRGF